MTPTGGCASCGAQGPVLRVIQLVGLDAVIACRPTVEQALDS